MASIIRSTSYFHAQMNRRPVSLYIVHHPLASVNLYMALFTVREMVEVQKAPTTTAFYRAHFSFSIKFFVMNFIDL